MIRSLAKTSVNTLLAMKAPTLQPAVLPLFQMANESQLSTRVTFGFTTKDDKGKKDPKDKPK